MSSTAGKSAAELKKLAKAKRQEKARARGGAVAKKEKNEDIDEVAEELDAAAKELQNMNVAATSASVANEEARKARNVTGPIPA
jgi:hypothetical protein